MTENLKVEEVAKKIIYGLGGAGNIVSTTHCVTRLRFVVENERRVKTDMFNEEIGVKGIFYKEGQFQVVIGKGNVKEIYEKIMELFQLPEADILLQPHEGFIFK
ncbi:MAG: PTS glucose/sucrose transporter subunit IIB [Fusobacterium mortiferum]|nr:PTS glucose/sucrose transporter subunit IIB [Fusobacterium mortiferum]